jgi:hypothetical protein
MTEERIEETYRNHTLLAAFNNGSYKGKVWGPDNKELGAMVTGSGLAEIMIALKARVDLFIEQETAKAPGVTQYVLAFQKILASLPHSYLQMLKAHYHAPNRTVNLAQLAEASSFANYNAAVLHYGKLGGRLHEHLPIKLPRHKDGKLMYTHMLAEGDVGEEEHRQWKMRPEVAAAMEQLGLCN